MAGRTVGHGFHETKQGIRYTLSESARREVLGRLLTLNHERYAEEVEQGLHDKKGKSKAKRRVDRPDADDERALVSARRDLFDTQMSLGEALD